MWVHSTWMARMLQTRGPILGMAQHITPSESRWEKITPREEEDTLGTTTKASPSAPSRHFLENSVSPCSAILGRITKESRILLLGLLISDLLGSGPYLAWPIWCMPHTSSGLPHLALLSFGSLIAGLLFCNTPLNHGIHLKHRPELLPLPQFSVSVQWNHIQGDTGLS